MIYIGIDNGVSGALVALSDHPGPPLGMIPMPLQGKSKGSEIDCYGVSAWIFNWRAMGEISVIIETPGKHSPGVLALCSMWDSYGALRSICEQRLWRHHRIAPVTWQKAMLPGCEKGMTKPAALGVAKRLWPEERWLKSPRCKTPDTGLIDAALIAEYGRIKKL